MNSPVTFSHWHTEPALIGGLLFICWCYAIIIGPYRESLCHGLAYSKKHTYWFAACIITFYLAVGSPLDALGENFLFFAHMIQHNILMYLCPLFLLFGIPAQIFDEFIEKRPLLEICLKFVFHPIIAGLLFTLVLKFGL